MVGAEAGGALKRVGRVPLHVRDGYRIDNNGPFAVEISTSDEQSDYHPGAYPFCGNVCPK